MAVIIVFFRFPLGCCFLRSFPVLKIGKIVESPMPEPESARSLVRVPEPSQRCRRDAQVFRCLLCVEPYR
jgi:hypothetical protein